MKSDVCDNSFFGEAVSKLSWTKGHRSNVIKMLIGVRKKPSTY